MTSQITTAFNEAQTNIHAFSKSTAILFRFLFYYTQRYKQLRMAIIAKRIPSTWFDRDCPEFTEGLTMTGHPELVEGCCNVCANN